MGCGPERPKTIANYHHDHISPVCNMTCFVASLFQPDHTTTHHTTQIGSSWTLKDERSHLSHVTSFLQQWKSLREGGLGLLAPQI